MNRAQPGRSTGPVAEFSPARPRRILDEIIGQIHDMVRVGRLRTGDRLPSERELAEQFAVSRNTVREALRMLEISGVLYLRRGPAGGAFIAAADPHRVSSNLADLVRRGEFSFSDMTEARRWIHSIVVRVAAERGDEHMFARLEANIAEAERLSRAEDWDRKAVVHVAFHDELAQGTGNPVLAAIVESLSGVMLEVVLAVGPTREDVVLESRRRLLRHLRARDADAAVAEMLRHQEQIHAMWVEGRYQGSRVLGGPDPAPDLAPVPAATASDTTPSDTTPSDTAATDTAATDTAPTP